MSSMRIEILRARLNGVELFKDMEWQLINASDWQCVENEEVIRYYSGQDHVCFQAFAWLQLDKKSKKILCARDHFGQEPFYYGYDEHRFFLAQRFLIL